MFNRTLRRPMFRRGGKAEGGITSGLKRQGYVHGGDIDDHTNASGSYFKPDNTMSNNMSDINKVQKQTDFFNKAFPQYNNAGSDFFMNLGSNILSAPGGNPILQTLGTAAKPALAQMQKTNMANTAGKRDVAMAMWKNLDEDTKTRMMKDAQYLVEQGVFPDIQAALESEIYSKQKRPEVKAQEELDTRVANIMNSKSWSYQEPEAIKLAQHQTKVIKNKENGGYSDSTKKLIDIDQYYIDTDAMGASNSEGQIAIPQQEVDNYIDGKIYLNLIDGQLYTKQGGAFIIYEEDIEDLT
jgi:hypothetical protein